MLDARPLSTTFTVTTVGKRAVLFEPLFYSNLVYASDKTMLPRDSLGLVAFIVDLSTPQSHNRHHQRFVRTNVVLYDCGYSAHEFPRDVTHMHCINSNPQSPTGLQSHDTLRLPHEHNDPIPSTIPDIILLVPIIVDNTQRCLISQDVSTADARDDTR